MSVTRAMLLYNYEKRNQSPYMNLTLTHCVLPLKRLGAFLFIFALLLDCGAALTYQQTEEAAQQSNSNSSSSAILAALGVSGGTGLASFSPSHISFKAGNSGSYDIVFSKWPLTGLHGTINVNLVMPGVLSSMTLTSFNIADDDQGYPLHFPNVASSGKPGSGVIQHTITSAPDASLNGTSLGTVSVTVTP
ncbi:hypothetical protein EHQ53_04905 [Leptospira langatensis]|uniref:Uncharacterized protein n=1 Tax=Leptospira langatensis TaxID=2484983 RepID=A0A5F1ZYH3_9LEPT|nr:hypothetical protein [Leptospira langatensis]TGK00155.1 hypothetical protein EHO57_12765 [Leptospira langatensis]TGL42790.1 hypothetical protein EHQ53_04905 [Leptospira langatensis]